MAAVIDRVKAEAWFKGLDEQAQRRLVEVLTRDPRAQDKVGAVLDKLDAAWKELNQVQRRAQVEGIIDLEARLRGDSESLEAIEWYQGLDPGEQENVRRTIHMNTRIRSATPRTVAQPDEAEIQASNPWHHVLNA
jgi:hypothetical protein